MNKNIYVYDGIPTEIRDLEEIISVIENKDQIKDFILYANKEMSRFFPFCLKSFSYLGYNFFKVEKGDPTIAFPDFCEIEFSGLLEPLEKNNGKFNKVILFKKII